MFAKSRGRDQNGYSLEGVDEVPDGKLESSLSKFVGLLQEANKRADNWKDMPDTLQRKHNALYQDYVASSAFHVRRNKIPHQPVRPLRCVTAAARVKNPSRVLNWN